LKSFGISAFLRFSGARTVAYSTPRTTSDVSPEGLW
jgi:hypothetical protein